MNNNQEDQEAPQIKQQALQMAVLHHGLANLSNESVPAGWRSVLKTANMFVSWLGGHAPEDETETHGNTR